MAGETIDKASITMFSQAVHVKAQQHKSLMAPYVNRRPLIGKQLAYDSFFGVEAQEIFGRYSRVQFATAIHERRQLTKRRFAVTLPIDASDARNILLSQEGLYADAVAKAQMRIFDRVGFDAVFASIREGENFENTITYAADGGLTTDATGGITAQTLTRIITNFQNRAVMEDIPVVLFITGDEAEVLMNDTDLTSGDYTRQMPFDSPTGLVMAHGIPLVKFPANVPNPIIPVSGTTRDCLALKMGGLMYGVSKEMSVEIKPRNEFHETEQLTSVAELAALRTEGVLVNKVQTTVTT